MRYLINKSTNTLNKNMARLTAFSIALIIYIIGFSGAALAQPINVTVTTTVSGVNQATFTATENGAAKENVNIYIDGALSGQTGLKGTYVASGFSTGSHAWDAEYGGGSVGTGKFVVFGYNILATGTDSPPINFSYAINVTASRSGVWGSDAGTSGEEHTLTFIGTPGLADGIYIRCKRREIRTNFNYGITFDSNPSISISSTGYSGSNKHVRNSYWTGLVEERRDGSILKSYVYYVKYKRSGKSIKDPRWFPNDNAQFSITWTGKKTGNNTVGKNDSYKHIETISSAPTSGTSLSLTVNGVTKHGVDSVEEGGIKLFFVGNELRAAYIARDAPKSSWSHTCPGTGSVTDKDGDIKIGECPFGAPNKDTQYSLDITVDGVRVHDQDGNDRDRKPKAIEYKGVIAWMQGKELHTSMSYHPPAAFIDSISPVFCKVGDPIAFSGHGEAQDAGDTITAYKWRSHKDGVLGNSDAFTTTSLSSGRHVIYFQAADSAPTPLWSPEATESIRINKPPTAYISSIRGTGIDKDGYPTLVLGEPMTFRGVGIDTDGEIEHYEWRSNIDGNLGHSESFSISDLPTTGHHTIYFRVKDSYGEWSKEAAQEVIVRRTPVVFIGGYDALSWIPTVFTYRPEYLDPIGTESGSNLHIEARMGDLIHWAQKLSDGIHRLKLDTGTKKVDIVAFSAGGLIARWYIEKGYRNDVRKFISLASPHHGLDWGHVGGLIEGAAWFTREVGGARQIIPHSHFLNELNGHDGCSTTSDRGKDSKNSSVEYYVITANCLPTPIHHHLVQNHHPLPKIFHHLDFVYRGWGRGDAAVAEYSAKIDGVVKYTDGFCGFHPGYQKLSYVQGKVTEILHDNSSVQQNIVQAASAGTLTLQLQDEGDSTELPESSLTSFHWLEPISGTVFPGGIKSHTTQIEPDITRAVFVLPRNCELDLALFTPSGSEVDPSDLDITYTKLEGYISYEIFNPEFGQWILEVTEPGLAESDCSYAIRTFMETDLFVGVATDAKEYMPNDPMVIYAYVQDNGVPLGTATVKTEIQKPDGSLAIIYLFDDGNHGDGDADDGVYANIFEDTSVRGAYDILVVAAIPKNGETYSRSSRTTVWVELYPDLAISDSDIAFSNTNPQHGDTVTITATIRNIGDDDADEVKILFFDGDPGESGVSIGEETIDLPAGGITDVSVPWKFTRGAHTIHVIISPFNTFLEQSYDNNRASADITVADTELPSADAGQDQVALIDTPLFFDGSGSTDNAEIVVSTWDVDTSVDSDGDGITDNDVDLAGVNPVFTGGYHSTGTYVVKLSVNDADGNGPVSDTLMVDVTSEYDRFPPNAVAGSDQTAKLKVPVFFDASQSSDNFGIASYQWDIDISVDSDQDGVPDNDIDLIGVRPILAGGYPKSGAHIVKLTVDDVAGNGPVVDTLTVTIVNGPPVADAGGPYIADEGSLVMLDGSGSVDPDGGQLLYSWDFDNDGTWDTGWSAISTAHYTWGDDHSGMVSVEASDGDLSNIATAQVIINNVAPEVEAGTDKTIGAGDIVSFTGFIIDPGEFDTHTINWDFGDGNSASGNSNVTHKYDGIGDYLVELTVTDDDGGTGKDTLLVSVISTAPWHMFHHDAKHTGRSPYTGPQDNTLLWTYDGMGDEVNSSPAVDEDGTTYVGSEDFNLYAISPDGALKWRYPTEGGIYSSPAIGNDGTIYVGSRDHNLYAINPDGILEWFYSTGGEVNSSPAIGNNNTIYVGSYDGKLYALSPGGTLKCEYSAFGVIHSSPAIGPDGVVYVGSSNENRLHAVYPDCTSKWESDPMHGNVINSSPALSPHGAVVYYGSDDGYLYARNTSDGSLKWQSPWTYGGIQSSPAIGLDGTIYVGTQYGNLWAIDSEDGSLKWDYYTALSARSSPAIGSDGTIYFATSYGHIYAMNPNDTVKWIYEGNYSDDGHFLSSPSIGSNGALYIGSTIGKLYAFSLLGDINNDNCVDRIDYDIIMADIRGPELHDLAYDLNGDGVVNRADARTLVGYFTNPRGAACN